VSAQREWAYLQSPSPLWPCSSKPHYTPHNTIPHTISYTHAYTIRTCRALLPAVPARQRSRRTRPASRRPLDGDGCDGDRDGDGDYKRIASNILGVNNHTNTPTHQHCTRTCVDLAHDAVAARPIVQPRACERGEGVQRKYKGNVKSKIKVGVEIIVNTKR
jgi:hypothetical protein